MKYCLIADDNDLNREVFISYIEEIGLEAGFAVDGDEALEKCLQRMPDCILLDWHMPGLDGVGFVKTLRQMKEGQDPIVIMCTCEDLEGNERAKDLLEHGINGFLTKPVYYKDIEEQFKELNLI